MVSWLFWTCQNAPRSQNTSSKHTHTTAEIYVSVLRPMEENMQTHNRQKKPSLFPGDLKSVKVLLLKCLLAINKLKHPL